MLVECERCGAPLDVKDAQRFIACSYCRATSRVQSLRTMAMQTPPNWQPPSVWVPREGVALGASQLRYHGPSQTVDGGGGSAGCVVACAAVLALGLVGGAASFLALRAPGSALRAARSLQPYAEPTLGIVRFDASNRGRPEVRAGISGGSVASSSIDPQCRGFFPAAPHLALELAETAQVDLLSQAASDTTLALRTPQGAWLCDDDSGGGRNPRLQLPLSPGRYLVWVGAYASSAPGAFSLTATATEPPRPGVVGDEPAAFAAQRPEHVDGFDRAGRLEVEGSAGGPVRGERFAARCRGYFSLAPALRFELPSARRVRFATVGTYDLTLVARSDRGAVLCDDDSGDGLNPRIEGAMAAGTWEVFVGTYAAGSTVPYRLRGGLEARATTGAPQRAARAPRGAPASEGTAGFLVGDTGATGSTPEGPKLPRAR